jgi:3-oxocholest-4-en-26-oyl-CoA dehydrogenase alpha subunit
MHISYTPEQEQLRQQLREYFAALMTPERRAGLAHADGEYGDGVTYKEVVRQLGRDGWLALGWPAEYGGQDRSVLDQLIFTDEAATAGVPVPFLTINTVGPTIMRFGTPAQKERFLPQIAAGDLHFSIGYSEPGAGTDLASLRTRAVRDGDSYVINGQKMWTSLIQYADYIWLACRTDPEAPRHKGLSIIIVPTDADGFSWTPVRTVAGVTTSATYYSDVRVPAGNVVGEEHKGWPLISISRRQASMVSSVPYTFVAEATAGGLSIRNGCNSTSPASTPRPSSSSWSTGASRRQPGRQVQPSPPRRRCTAPSSPSRPAAC